MYFIEKIKKTVQLVSIIDERLQKIQQALGRLENRQLATQSKYNFHDYEYQVYSQWGEDGLIQYLVNRVLVEFPIFIEFGVENYTESNTRFLLINNNWSGLIFDGAEQNIRYIKNDSIYWRHNLKAECAFINCENINSLLQNNGVSGDIGLLSVDIDGNDYWVWKAITVVSPRIVVCEYNSLWGPALSVTTPYDPNFIRGQAHFSNLYYGASITALTNLAIEKGYSLVGSNSAGNNIFFVRNDLLSTLQVCRPGEVWVKSQFREARNEAGQLTNLLFDERLKLLADLSLVDTVDGHSRKISSLYLQN